MFAAMWIAFFVLCSSFAVSLPRTVRHTSLGEGFGDRTRPLIQSILPLERNWPINRRNFNVRNPTIQSSNDASPFAENIPTPPSFQPWTLINIDDKTSIQTHGSLSQNDLPKDQILPSKLNEILTSLAFSSDKITPKTTLQPTFNIHGSSPNQNEIVESTTNIRPLIKRRASFESQVDTFDPAVFNNLFSALNQEIHEQDINSLVETLASSLQSNSFPSNIMRGKTSPSYLTSTEDIHTDPDHGSPFGISLLSNDGINNINFGNRATGHISVTPPELFDNTLKVTQPVEKSDTALNQALLHTGVPLGAIPTVTLPTSIVAAPGSVSLRNRSDTIILDSSENLFTRGPFGVPLESIVTSVPSPTPSVAAAISVKLEDDDAPSVKPIPIQINSGKPQENPSLSNDILGDMTLGQLLLGINGQNGIRVVPMSSANTIIQTSISSPSSSEVVSTTSEAPTTRRRSSRRRTTTRPPEHIRTSLSDILYAKGQWFGTLIGGLIDFGKIAIDAFKRSRTNSNKSYETT